jgi:hypothetical protein
VFWNQSNLSASKDLEGVMSVSLSSSSNIRRHSDHSHAVFTGRNAVTITQNTDAGFAIGLDYAEICMLPLFKHNLAAGNRFTVSEGEVSADIPSGSASNEQAKTQYQYKQVSHVSLSWKIFLIQSCFWKNYGNDASTPSLTMEIRNKFS